MALGGDQKAAVMNQVRQEAAMTNARQLIEVRNTVLSVIRIICCFILELDIRANRCAGALF
jgi:hypothetical protein